MKKTIIYIFICIVISSCATSFSGRSKHVHINTNQKGTEVTNCKGETIGETPLDIYLLKNENNILYLKKEGYISEQICFFPNKIAPSTPLLNSFTLGIGYFIDVKNGSGLKFNKDSIYIELKELPDSLISMNETVAVKDINFTISKNEMCIAILFDGLQKNLIDGSGLMKKINVINTNNYISGEILEENEYNFLLSDLNKNLIEYGFNNKNEEELSLFSNYEKSYLITGDITQFDLTFNIPMTYGKEQLFQLTEDIQIDWIVSNKYKNNIKTFSIGTTLSYYMDTSMTVFPNVIQRNFFKLLSLKDFIEFVSTPIKNENENENENENKEPIYLTKGEKPTTFKDVFNCIVCINANGNKFPSPVISKDGIILTNAHILDDTSSFLINDAEDSIYAKVIAKNQYYDLALLKISDTIFHNTFEIKNIETEIVQNVFAIDKQKKSTYPDDSTKRVYPIGKGKNRFYLKKGIIGGFRTFGNRELIQIDIPLEENYCGSPLLDKNKNLIGIISTRYESEHVETINFAIPNKTILEILNIKYLDEAKEQTY